MRQFIIEHEGTLDESSTTYDDLIDSLPLDEVAESSGSASYTTYRISDASEVFL
jgi:hypothetical protein